MNEPEHDALLEAWLRRSSSLHEQLARLDRAEPPDELDRIVLERARHAIRQPRGVEPLRQMRWALPIGLAATLLVSFVLLLQVAPSHVKSTPEPSERARALAGDGAAAPAKDAADESPRSAPPARVPTRTQATPAAPSARTPAPVAATRRPVLPALEEYAGRIDGASKSEPAADVQSVKAREVWLAEIEKLRARGLADEADRELAAFRRAYPPAPAATVPPDR